MEQFSEPADFDPPLRDSLLTLIVVLQSFNETFAKGTLPEPIARYVLNELEAAHVRASAIVGQLNSLGFLVPALTFPPPADT